MRKTTDRSKIQTSVLCRIPKGTFLPSLVPIGEVVSEEKTFERKNRKNRKKRRNGQLLHYDLTD